MSLFLRLLDVPVDDKAAALKAAAAGDGAIFDCDPEAFAAVPGSPFAYWASPDFRAIFQRFPRFEIENRIARKGLTTSDDGRYVRVWWEPEAAMLGQLWFTYAKGGTAQLFWAPIYTVVRWDPLQRTIPGYCGRPGRETPTVECADIMGRPGLTWPLRASSFSPSVLPSASVFSARGYTIQAPIGELPVLLAVTASTAFDAVFKLCLGRSGHPEFIVGVLQQLPLPRVDAEESLRLAGLARRAWSLKRTLDTTKEISQAFLLPDGLNTKVASLDSAVVDQELGNIKAQIDDAAFPLYGISEEERANIEGPIKQQTAPDSDQSQQIGVSEGAADEAVFGEGVEASCSWLVGVSFARFDPRLATGERPIPPEPEPFDPLPARSPGMYPEGEEPADRPDILVDDEGHAHDLAARAQAVAERVRVDVPEDLRGWLARDFFPLHIKMYSKSRRKAPIYWQLATPSASYSVWLYIHAFTQDTLFRVQNDYVSPKLAHEERRLEALTLELRDGAIAVERKALDEQQTLVEELRAFLAEVKRVAPIWNPNLDDGVIINFSLLWRLVPQHKPWQKELKKTWDALCEGKYDWAHLAMHLWPERVVPKCATDRSLAIAHDLESAFWEEDKDGKWQPVKVPQAEIDQLIAERSSAAVKDALQSLLDAPPPATGRGGGRRASSRGPARRTRSTTGRQRSGASAAPDPAVMDSIKQAIEATSDGASKADVLAATGLSDAQWNGAIAALLADGSVTKFGAGRGTRYHLLNPEP